MTYPIQCRNEEPVKQRQWYPNHLFPEFKGMQGDIDGWEVKKSKVIDVEIAGRVHGADMKSQAKVREIIWILATFAESPFCHRSSWILNGLDKVARQVYN